MRGIERLSVLPFIVLLKVSHGFGRGGHGMELLHFREMRRFENFSPSSKNARFLLKVSHGASLVGLSALEALFRYE